jgi:hypothetical protein
MAIVFQMFWKCPIDRVDYTGFRIKMSMELTTSITFFVN